jgi:predicted lysophospholipase L1 biosynthesis ABC-type transport system permease subunit
MRSQQEVLREKRTTDVVQVASGLFGRLMLASIPIGAISALVARDWRHGFYMTGLCMALAIACIGPVIMLLVGPGVDNLRGRP